MDADEAAIELALLRGCNVDAVQRLVDVLTQQAGSAWFYVFRVGGSSGRGAGPVHTRTVLAFATPDTAFTFAQRNSLSDDENGPRLRRVRLTQMLLAMARDPSIAAVLLVRDDDVPRHAGQLPSGIAITREMVDRQLRVEGSGEPV